MIDKVNLKGTLHEIHDSRLIVKDDLPHVGKFETVSQPGSTAQLLYEGIAYWLEDLSNRWWSLTPQERENYRNPIFLRANEIPVFDGTLKNSSSVMLLMYVSSDEENQSQKPKFQGIAYTSVWLSGAMFYYSENPQGVTVDGEEWPGGHVVQSPSDSDLFFCEVGVLSGDPDHVPEP